MLPATRITKRSPKPWPKTSSAGTRESEQPRMIANGSWPALGPSAGLATRWTKRRLPSRRRASASGAGITGAHYAFSRGRAPARGMIRSRRRLRAPNRETQRREIADLNHQRGHAAVASLRVHLAALHERHLTRPDGVSHPIAALDPARPLHRRE